MGEYSKALSSHERSLDILKIALPPNHPNLASSYNNIGNVYSDMGEYSKALLSHERSLEIRKIALPPNHPDLAHSYNNIASLYNSMGEYSKALLFLERTLVIFEKSLAPNHPHIALTDLKCDESNVWSTTFEKLNIESELKLNILSGQVGIEEKGKYLKTANKSEEIDRIVLSCMYQVKQQLVDIAFKSVNKCICPMAFADKSTTHVITGILWGANVFATFDLHKTTENKQLNVLEKLIASIRKCMVLLKTDRDVEAEFQDQDSLVHNQLSIHFSGDIEMEQISATFLETVAMISNIPTNVKK
ncbi:unnamed protein product [Rotaria magnacalcarata]|uniref:Kinesin light chain n=1 Tax=Rotaria magnacalcarata TaxID=392030 RepID=A0A8S2JR78_9BILA|nr:unnamed protein product [Rotaria magnacalcarata]